MSRNRPSELALVLMNKGQYSRIKPVDCKVPWRGTDRFEQAWDPIQAAENRRLYPSAFR